jgi:ubiquinone/menaquinone biosynthesis C-methylase UbiE
LDEACHCAYDHYMAALVQTFDRAAYRAHHLVWFLPSLAGHRALRAVARVPEPETPPALVRAMRRRYERLLRVDLDNAHAGLYPRALLYQRPSARYVRALPHLLADMPRSIRRKARGNWRDLPENVDRERFPAYFRRTFHWQTDGYFSQRSARLYDLGVEFLFLGTADVMRRQVIPPITRFLRERGRYDARVLDVACGTGRTLLQLHRAHPRLRLHGVDLSPAYVQAARMLLADAPEVTLVAENAETLPYRDGHFDVVTSTFLFHELPRPTRRRVLAEMLRVVAPGGLAVVEDSAQAVESADVLPVLERFPVEFHEPFYAEYLQDDLAEAMREVGFEVQCVATAFLAKVVVARRPPTAS